MSLRSLSKEQKKEIKNETIVSKFKDITGEVFTRLTVMSLANEKHNGRIAWKCKCECGNIVSVVGYKLRSGATKSCGCLKREILESFRRDLVGEKFGLLIVISFSHTQKEKTQTMPYWNCICDCGNEVVARGNRLKNGDIKSCGCLHIKNTPRGAKHHNWSDNLTDEERGNRRQSRENALWTKSVLEKDEFLCTLCEVRSDLIAHHKDGYGWCVERRTDIDNGATLCRSCHKAFHGKYGYSNNTEAQFIEYCEQ